MPKFQELDKSQKEVLFAILKHKFNSDKSACAKWLNERKDSNMSYTEWRKVALVLKRVDGEPEGLQDTIKLATQIFP